MRRKALPICGRALSIRGTWVSGGLGYIFPGPARYAAAYVRWYAWGARRASAIYTGMPRRAVAPGSGPGRPPIRAGRRA